MTDTSTTSAPTAPAPKPGPAKSAQAHTPRTTPTTPTDPQEEILKLAHEITSSEAAAARKRLNLYRMDPTHPLVANIVPTIPTAPAAPITQPEVPAADTTPIVTEPAPAEPETTPAPTVAEEPVDEPSEPKHNASDYHVFPDGTRVKKLRARFRDADKWAWFFRGMFVLGLVLGIIAAIVADSIINYWDGLAGVRQWEVLINLVGIILWTVVTVAVAYRVRWLTSSKYRTAATAERAAKDKAKDEKNKAKTQATKEKLQARLAQLDES